MEMGCVVGRPWIEPQKRRIILIAQKEKELLQSGIVVEFMEGLWVYSDLVMYPR